MDVSTIADAQKGSEPGCFATKVAPVVDSVGADKTTSFADGSDMTDTEFLAALALADPP